jgi:hypothetical protein
MLLCPRCFRRSNRFKLTAIALEFDQTRRLRNAVEYEWTHVMSSPAFVMPSDGSRRCRL